MNFTSLFFLPALAAVIITAGCTSKPEPVPPREFVNVPVYVANQTIPADSQEKYLSNPVLRSYAIGRYVDPVTGAVMHEEHSVYRKMSDPAWNLIPQRDAEPIRQVESTRQERYAGLFTGEMTRTSLDLQSTRQEVDEVRTIQEEYWQNTQLLRQELEALQTKHQIVVENLRKTTEYVAALEKQVKMIQNSRSEELP